MWLTLPGMVAHFHRNIQVVVKRSIKKLNLHYFTINFWRKGQKTNEFEIGSR